MRKPKSDPTASSGWDRFRSCDYCGFNFCSFCKHTWSVLLPTQILEHCSNVSHRHGALTECPKSATHAVIMEYMDLPEGSSERTALERKFGRHVILKLVKDYEEEESTKQWMQSSTTACPRCKVSIEKSMGCNHVNVFYSLSFFCFTYSPFLL